MMKAVFCKKCGFVVDSLRVRLDWISNQLVLGLVADMVYFSL